LKCNYQEKHRKVVGKRGKPSMRGKVLPNHMAVYPSDERFV